MRQNRAEQLTKWRGLISDQLSSGQTVAAFCRDRGIRDSQFYDWKKRIRKADAAKFVAVEVTAAREAVPSKPIEIRLSKGRSLFVEAGFNAGHLHALLAVLETEL